jgi:CubicO group peptidase (beta-lactamase class C family)
VSTPESLRAELDRLTATEQRDKRLPSIAAAVVRDGETVWETAVGAADVSTGAVATPDTQYRIGSITKTFTAAAIMQLRDAGKLDLEDTLEKHVDGAAHTPSLRRLLSHTSGMQRETHDDAWLNARFAAVPELLETLDRAEQVLPAGARFHYSNLAFALLGVVVERVGGLPYREYVEQRLLQPLGLARISFDPVDPAATGYLVQPYTEGVWDEAPVETGAWIAAGQMWGTVGDLCRWAAFLAAPDEAVLAKRTVEEMRTVLTLSDHLRWTQGYGLGLQLFRDGERILTGHGGSMPGFIAAVMVSPSEKIGAATLTNSSEARLGALTQALIRETVSRFPVPPEPWRVAEPPPDDVAPLLGIWFMEGSQLAFRWKNGTLEAQFADAEAWEEPAVFERGADERWRIVSGWEQGEVLRIEDDRMVLAGYPVMREPGVWV